MYLFNVIRLKGDVYYLIGKFEEVFYFPSALVIVAKSFEKAFLRIFKLAQMSIVSSSGMLVIRESRSRFPIKNSDSTLDVDSFFTNISLEETIDVCLSKITF